MRLTRRKDLDFGLTAVLALASRAASPSDQGAKAARLVPETLATKSLSVELGCGFETC